MVGRVLSPFGLLDDGLWLGKGLIPPRTPSLSPLLILEDVRGPWSWDHVPTPARTLVLPPLLTGGTVPETKNGD